MMDTNTSKMAGEIVRCLLLACLLLLLGLPCCKALRRPSFGHVDQQSPGSLAQQQQPTQQTVPTRIPVQQPDRIGPVAQQPVQNVPRRLDPTSLPPQLDLPDGSPALVDLDGLQEPVKRLELVVEGLAGSGELPVLRNRVVRTLHNCSHCPGDDSSLLKRLCGSELTNALVTMCSDVFSGATSEPSEGSTMSITEACCDNHCPVQHLTRYCGHCCHPYNQTVFLNRYGIMSVERPRTTITTITTTGSPPPEVPAFHATSPNVWKRRRSGLPPAARSRVAARNVSVFLRQPLPYNTSVLPRRLHSRS